MVPKEALAKSLVDSLSEVADLLSRAKGVAEKQQQALVDNDAGVITASYKAQEEILRRIAESDSRAAASAERLAKGAGFDPDQVTRDQLGQIMGEPYASEMHECAGIIARLAAEVKEVHEMNKNLLRNGLEIVTCCMQALATGPATSGYAKDASVQKGQPYIISLDRKV